ncbi:MAG: hypothetical protein KAJ73_00200 [Zetaproteobacteria bacterium]|nr:hypothetical protein [Zetaproteobacteria bacterium]
METGQRREWLNDLKAGDKVIVEITQFKKPRKLKLLKVRARTQYGISIETRDRPNLYWATTGKAAGDAAADNIAHIILEPTSRRLVEWQAQGGNNG